MLQYLVVICLIFALFINKIANGEVETFMERAVRAKLNNLHNIVTKHINMKRTCSDDTFIYITDGGYGNTGNNMVSLTHSLWLARKLNATFNIPGFIGEAINHFNLTNLAEQHCFVVNQKIPSTSKSYGITAEESFFVYRLFNSPNKSFKAMLPPLDDEVVKDITHTFLNVYASLWSLPKPSIVTSAAWIIENYLGANFNYTSIHKRNLDGECEAIMSENSKISDYSPSELAMDSPEWSRDVEHHHPLCEMQLDFVKNTMKLHGRGDRNIFVAFDGQGDVTSYRIHRAVFSSVMQAHPRFRAIPMKYVDMLVAMLGDLFILNPRSTFSLQVYLVRASWELRSVPVQFENDFYFQKIPDHLKAEGRPMWVSLRGIQAEVQKLLAIGGG